jgi:hypothetical protein
MPSPDWKSAEGVPGFLSLRKKDGNGALAELWKAGKFNVWFWDVKF